MNGQKTAIIMAAGQGQRMLPLSEFVPKPMVMLKGVPLLQRIIMWLDKYDYKQIFVITNDNDWLIKNYPFVASGDCNIIPFAPINPEFGNACNIRHLMQTYKLSGRVLIVAGDVLTDFPLTIFEENGADRVNEVLLVRVKDKWSYPVIDEEFGKIKGFVEKPDYPHWVNGGVYSVKIDSLKLPNKGGMDWVLQNNDFFAVYNNEVLSYSWQTFDTFKDVLEYEVKKE